MTYHETPPLGSILYALEVPEVGGDTLFASQYLAYETLSDGMKDLLGDRTATHSSEPIYGKSGAFNMRYQGSKTMAKPKNDIPVIMTEQPIFRTHPETGRKAIYVGNHSSHVVGMDVSEGETLLAELEVHATQADFIYRHKWQVNDVIMWDNRCTMHCVEPYDAAKEKRAVHRVVVKGDKPV